MAWRLVKRSRNDLTSGQLQHCIVAFAAKRVFALAPSCARCERALRASMNPGRSIFSQVWDFRYFAKLPWTGVDKRRRERSWPECIRSLYLWPYSRPSSVLCRPSSDLRRPSSVVRRPSCVVCRLSSVVRRASSIRRPLSVVCRLSSVARRPSSDVRRPSSLVPRPVVRRPPSVVRRPASVIRRPSSVVRRLVHRPSSVVRSSPLIAPLAALPRLLVAGAALHRTRCASILLDSLSAPRLAGHRSECSLTGPGREGRGIIQNAVALGVCWRMDGTNTNSRH